MFGKKLANNRGEGFLWASKFYKITNDIAIPPPKKRNPEGKSTVNPGGTAIKKQDETTTNQQTMRKIHVNELHARIFHPR